VKGAIDFVLEFALNANHHQLGLIWFDIRSLQLPDVLRLMLWSAVDELPEVSRARFPPCCGENARYRLLTSSRRKKLEGQHEESLS